MKNSINKLAFIIKCGGTLVFPTDTIYGILGSALNKKTVLYIYKIRKRNLHKPFIILIASISDIQKFSMAISQKEKAFLKNIWPGQVSVIFSCGSKRFFYLHRGTKKLAFRIPKKKNLIALLKKTGPLVAPSANIEGTPPAKNIRDAKKYFGNKINFYVNEGTISGSPSAIIEFSDNTFVSVRKGRIPISKLKSLYK